MAAIGVGPLFVPGLGGGDGPVVRVVPAVPKQVAPVLI